jgi:CrcB protein
VDLWLAVALAGAIGAPVRYLVDGWVSAHRGGPFPAGTLTVNVAGSAILGALAGITMAHHVGPLPRALVGTGFCGALTTFSTFTYETLQLAAEGAWVEAARNVAANVVLCLAVAGAAMALFAAL